MVSFNQVIAALVYRSCLLRLVPWSKVVFHRVWGRSEDPLQIGCVPLLVIVHLLNSLVVLLNEWRIKLCLSHWYHLDIFWNVEYLIDVGGVPMREWTFLFLLLRTCAIHVWLPSWWATQKLRNSDWGVFLPAWTLDWLVVSWIEEEGSASRGTVSPLRALASVVSEGF